MSIVKLHVLCEGQTELRFASKVLCPYLIMKGILVLPQMLITNRKLNARGGMLDFQQAKRDLQFMFRASVDSEQEIHYFTTMFNLYALPDDFPGFAEAMRLRDYEQVELLETAFAREVSNFRFIPYIQLHEFESLVLCDIDSLVEIYPNSSEELRALKVELRQSYGDNMELVDNGRETAPSKRIILALGKNYHYDKPKTGTEVTQKVGIDSLRIQCRHFDRWLQILESLSNSFEI